MPTLAADIDIAIELSHGALAEIAPEELPLFDLTTASIAPIRRSSPRRRPETRRPDTELKRSARQPQIALTLWRYTSPARGGVFALLGSKVSSA